jgi:hypothetical protein
VNRKYVLAEAIMPNDKGDAGTTRAIIVATALAVISISCASPGSVAEGEGLPEGVLRQADVDVRSNIGARTMEQFESNLVALGVTLDESQTAALDEASTPTLSFPMPFLEMGRHLMHGGATVDGVPSERFPMAPESDEERY